MAKSSRHLKKERVFWPNSIQFCEDGLHQNMVAKLCLAAQKGAKSATGLEFEKLEKVCGWLIDGLYQSYFAVPQSPLVLPLSKDAYRQGSSYGIPFGYRIVHKAYKAAQELGFISVVDGLWVKGKKGRLTRLRPSGRLLKHFDELGLRWRNVLAPEREAGIYLNPGKGPAYRRQVGRHEYPNVAAMQDSLFRINTFLGDQCISIDLPNTALRIGFPSKVDSDLDNDAQLVLHTQSSGKPALSMQNVFLHRVFAQGEMTKGGRFYGAWWQQIPSKMRRRILINEDITVECDYSGLACSILYAMHGLSPPADAYDIGLNYGPDDRRRKLVKKYMNAMLNDSSRHYKLHPSELAVIGLTHSELRERLCLLHAPIAKHFNTGVGIELQFFDSEMALEVMLRLMDQGEVCLPIHDSFIVRLQTASLLLKTMSDVFQERFSQSPGIKPEFGYGGASMGRPKKDLLACKGLTMEEKFTRHIDEYSVVREFYLSWERSHFSEFDIELRCRALNSDVAALKGAEQFPIHKHKFFGLQAIMSARP